MCFGVETSLSPGVEVLDPEAFHAPDVTPAGSVAERLVGPRGSCMITPLGRPY